MHTLPQGVHFFERGWLSSNNVLIQDSDQAILIDTGYWTHAEQTHALIAAALDQKPLTSIVNTHLHSDHCGANAHLQSIYPHVQTFVPPGHASFVDAWDADVLTYIPTGQHCPRFNKTSALSDGQTLHIAGQTWKIHAAPGHDPHSVVIFNEADGILISADALWQNGFGVVFPEIEGLSAFDEVGSTLDIIEKLDPKLVLPGHGSAFSDVAAAIDRARSRLEQFRSSPEKHASYAAKVLLKFKLLELQKCKRIDFFKWAESTQYLKVLFARYGHEQSFEQWYLGLCTSLVKNGACAIDGEFIFNMN